MITKRSHILKQICSWKLQVCLSVWLFLLPPDIKGFTFTWFRVNFSKFTLLFKIYSVIQVKYNNFLENGNIIELSKAATIKHELKKMSTLKSLSNHERRIRLSMERQMVRHNVPYIVSPYAYPVVPLPETHELLYKRKSKKSR